MNRKFTRIMPCIVLGLLFWAPSSYGEIFVVNVQDFQFSPANIPNVLVGDIIRFTWVSGNHTTTCDPSTDEATALPAGADPWNSPMNSTSTTFDYEVKVAGAYHYLCVPHRSGMRGSFTASAVLPVKLGPAQVISNKGNPLVQWSTFTEENVDHFSILKSFTGNTFSEIGQVKAAGHSTVKQNYQFEDKHLSDGHAILYYLVATVDRDGKKQYSPIMSYNAAGSLKSFITSITPNPITAGGHVMLTYNAAAQGMLNVTVVNVNGQKILEAKMNSDKGFNNGHLHMGGVPAGTYTIEFNLNGMREIRKVLVK